MGPWFGSLVHWGSGFSSTNQSRVFSAFSFANGDARPGYLVSPQVAELARNGGDARVAFPVSRSKPLSPGALGRERYTNLREER